MTLHGQRYCDRWRRDGSSLDAAPKAATLAVLGLAVALSLSACATDQQGVAVRIVEVPVPHACVDPAQVPTEPPQVGSQLTGDAVHDLGIVAPSALELRAYGRALRALIVPGCTTLP